jgi:uncharacterized DUF497 family protein
VIVYEWDETKRAKNLAKHGVDFAAATDFDWTAAVVAIDNRRDYSEIRYRGIGFIGPRLHMMAFTNRGITVRIISLRKANNLEVRKYEKGTRSS